MPGHILIADPDLHRRLALKSRLQSAYFFVETLASPPLARGLHLARRSDLVFLAAAPQAFAILTQLRADPAVRHIPVVITLDAPELQLAGDTGDAAVPRCPVTATEWLLAGADDVRCSTQPARVLHARTRMLINQKQADDELVLTDRPELADAETDALPYHRLQRDTRPVFGFGLAPDHPLSTGLAQVSSTGVGPIALKSIADIQRRTSSSPDAQLLVEMTGKASAEAGLHLIANLKSDSATRTLPIVMVLTPEQHRVAERGLELGASDVVSPQTEAGEVAARFTAADRRRYHSDQLRSRLTNQLRLALTDPMTGLSNRRYIETYGPRVLQECRDAGHDCALILLDIDRFKQINDVFGHAAGDRIITATAQRIQRAVRRRDLVARIGGEEFLVVLPNTDAAHAATVAERIRKAVCRRPVLSGQFGDGVTVTVSAGVSVIEAASAVDFRCATEQADQALYRSKAAGRNCIHFAEAA